MADLPDVMRLYEKTNQVRSGPTVRSVQYWRAQPSWTREDPDGFLVTRGPGGSLTGYIRSRGGPSGVEVIELGVTPGELTCGRALVESVATRHSGEIDAQLPPSLYEVFPRPARQTRQVAGLMGRVLDLEGLLTALEPVLMQRAPAAGRVESALSLATDLTERDRGHLLFHGYDELAAQRLDSRHDADVLKALFPAQDFVIWPSDAF
jgi:hypothetical protein